MDLDWKNLLQQVRGRGGSIPITKNLILLEKNGLLQKDVCNDQEVYVITKQGINLLQSNGTIICPGCKSPKEFQLSNAKRPRKICPKCQKKTEISKWIQEGPSDQKREFPKDHQTKSCEKVPIAAYLQQESVKKVLQAIKLKFNQTNIAKSYYLPLSTVHRIIKKLTNEKIIEKRSGYPIYFKLMIEIETDQQSQTYTTTLKSLDPTFLPKIQEFHKIIFETPTIREFGRDPKHLYDKELWDAKKNTEMKGWTKYEYPNDIYVELGIWSFQVCTDKCLSIFSQSLLPGQDPMQTLEELKNTIPFSFLQKRGLKLIPEKTKVNNLHTVVKTGDLEMDGLGKHAIVYTKNSFHADDSDKTGQDGIEFRGIKGLEKATSITKLSENIDIITQNLTLLTAEFSQSKLENTKLAHSLDTLSVKLETFVNLMGKMMDKTSPPSGLFS